MGICCTWTKGMPVFQVSQWIIIWPSQTCSIIDKIVDLCISGGNPQCLGTASQGTWLVHLYNHSITTLTLWSGSSTLFCKQIKIFSKNAHPMAYHRVQYRILRFGDICALESILVGTMTRLVGTMTLTRLLAAGWLPSCHCKWWDLVRCEHEI